MSGSGRAGSGRGNNRKRFFRRFEKENNTWQESTASESGNSQNSDSHTSRSNQRDSGSQMQDRRQQNRNQQKPFNKMHSGSRGRNTEENQNRQNRHFSKRNDENLRGEKPQHIERPKWVPPIINNEPLPVHNCPWCGRPIRDLSTAINDKETGAPVHFDCVTSRIAGGEKLEKGDVITYIGAGRFGIVNFNGSDSHDFKIKRIIEWENKDIKTEWRSKIHELYAVT